MKTALSLGLAAALALGPAAPAAARDALDILRGLQTLGAQAALTMLRGRVDLTYESVAVDARTGDLVLTGLEVRPRLEWDAGRRCRITAARVMLTGHAEASEGRLEGFVEADGLAIPSDCFQPRQAVMLASFGYDVVAVDAAALSVSYHAPSSGADVRLSAALAEAAEVSVAADLDYVGLRVPGEDGDEAEPVVKLGSAEVVIEDNGLWPRVQPLLGMQVGDVSAAPEMLRAFLSSALSEGRPLSPEKTALIDNVAEEVGRFVRDGDRLVLSLAPEGGAWLEDGLFQTPQRAIEALNPRLSAAPLAAERIVAPAVIERALGGEGDFPEAERLRVGRALMTGVGAPRAREAAARLLLPLAEGWQAEAALLLAEARAEAGEAEGAYAMALRAAAGRERGALALLERTEAALGVPAILSAQEAAFAAWPDRAAWAEAVAEAEETADVSALRRRAADASTGRGMPRSYAEAWRLAALAAAAGDDGAATLRERVETRLSGPDGVADPAWADRRATLSASVVEAWTSGGFGERAMRRYGLSD